MSSQKWIYAWLLPVLWLSVALVNFRYPGDEYMGFAVGASAGLWILAITGDDAEPRQLLPRILLAGSVTVLLAGGLMDKLQVPWIPWVILLLVAATAIGLLEFLSHSSVERALAKNGSYQAYVFPSINLGLYAATITMCVGTGISRLVTRKTTSCAGGR